MAETKVKRKKGGRTKRSNYTPEDVVHAMKILEGKRFNFCQTEKYLREMGYPYLHITKQTLMSWYKNPAIGGLLFKEGEQKEQSKELVEIKEKFEVTLTSVANNAVSTLNDVIDEIKRRVTNKEKVTNNELVNFANTLNTIKPITQNNADSGASNTGGVLNFVFNTIKQHQSNTNPQTIHVNGTSTPVTTEE